MNAELKKRRLEVFSDEPGPSTVSSPAPCAAVPSMVPAPTPCTAVSSTVLAPASRTAELFKPVEYLMNYINYNINFKQK